MKSERGNEKKKTLKNRHLLLNMVMSWIKSMYVYDYIMTGIISRQFFIFKCDFRILFVLQFVVVLFLSSVFVFVRSLRLRRRRRSSFMFINLIVMRNACLMTTIYINVHQLNGKRIHNSHAEPIWYCFCGGCKTRFLFFSFLGFFILKSKAFSFKAFAVLKESFFSFFFLFLFLFLFNAIESCE